MDDMKKRLNAINNILKKTDVLYYKEVVYFIDKFINGAFNLSEPLNNEYIAKILDLNRIKASKILSNLYKLKIIKRIGRNEYQLITNNQFMNLVYKWMEKSINKELINLDILFKRKNMVAFFENFDIINGFQFYNKIYNSININMNIYQENNISELIFANSWKNLTELQKNIITSTISREVYEILNKRYIILKNRLKKIIKNKNSMGKIYQINSPRIENDIFLTELSIKEFSKKKIKDYLITVFNNYKNEIYNLEEYIVNNKLLLIINLNHDKCNGPISLLGDHVFQFFQEDSLAPQKISMLYSYNNQLSTILTDKYMNLFKIVIAKITKERNKENIIATYYKEDLGQYLFEDAINKINLWITQIRNI